MHDRPDIIGQGSDRLSEHGVGQPGVRVRSCRAGDDPAVAAVNHRRDIHFAVTRLDSQVMSVKPLHGRPAGAEVPVDRVLGCRRALNPDGNRSDAYGEDAPPVPPGA